MQNLSVYGHIYTRVFTYTENGKYHELLTLGGAELLAKLLNVYIPIKIDKNKRNVYAELKRFENRQNKISYYAINRCMGFSDGIDTIECEPDSSDILVWDEGFSGLTVPKRTQYILWASNKVLPDKERFSEAAANCFLFLDADVLRGAGAMISREISWERTAAELIWQLQNNPVITYLMKAPHILISFAEDGAVYIQRENGKLKASLSLTHGYGEGRLREQLEGLLDDAFVLMTANLAMQFLDVLHGKQPLQIMRILKTAEDLMTSGYTIENLKNNDYPMKLEYSETSFNIPLGSGQNIFDTDSWCISNNDSDKRIFDIAFEYVMEGEIAIRGLPKLSFGTLTTIDRFEIEAYQNIRNLIISYAADNSVRPLSIAVFGSPGSGKSFGVTQIAKNVLHGKVEKLEFNVSQFTGIIDLGAAFQKVRDVILEGKLPLVFFDEFDSDRDGLPLGWVKSFLMPMQDGKFKDESGEHPLGKCILVFAGGTAASFEEFTAPMNPKYEIVNTNNGVDELNLLKKRPEDANREAIFKSVKGPDFISRLKGTINVLGPNPKDKNDKNYILRRALLLRSLCERRFDMKKGAAPVSKNIIWAMLLVPKYKYGARSIESILDMSRLEGNVWEPVSLPFYSQLALHVDADAFVKLVLRDVILNSYIEQLSQAIHNNYIKEMTNAGHTEHSSLVPWEMLPEDLKESNRSQARSISEKLKSVGYEYDSGNTPFPSVESFDETTILLLAQNEHMRWMNDRIEKGWSYASVRDNENKRHPLLVEWKKLPPEEQKKDIDVANNIISLLKSIGLRVYKTI